MIDIDKILELRRFGYCYRDIGEKLGVTHQTVRYHLKKKFGADISFIKKGKDIAEKPKKQVEVEDNEKQKIERLRIRTMIHNFCFNDEFCDVGCVNCPLNEFDVCGENVPMTRYRQAEKFIYEYEGVVHE